VNNRLTLNIDYAQAREKKRALRYRLRRRTHEVVESVRCFGATGIEAFIDLGTADGRMLNEIKLRYPSARCVGVELNSDLVTHAKTSFPDLEFYHGDALTVDFPAGSFDVAIASAVIEHVLDPGRLLKRIRRMLKTDGLLVITSPDPFWEKLATMLGHLQEDQHHRVMNLKHLCDLTQRSGFRIVNTRKFMLSPVGMPMEFFVEKWFLHLRLDFLMANQLVVARK